MFYSEHIAAGAEMFTKILDVLSSNATYTLSGVLFATAAWFFLKTFLEPLVKLFKLWKAVRKFPGPIGLPVLGVLPEVMGDTECTLRQFVRWTELYPSPCCGWLGPKLHFAVHDPDNIRELLQNQRVVDKPELYNFFRALFGNGLLTAEAREWRVHRKLITNVFNHRELPPYGAFLAEKAFKMAKEMEVELRGKGFDIMNYLPPCTLGMIFGVILGTSVGFETEELRNTFQDMIRFAEIIFLRLPRVWLHPDIIFNRTDLGRESKKLAKRLLATVEKALQQVDAEKNNAAANDTTAGSKSIPGLYMNLSWGRGDFTRQDFIDEINTIIPAGSHTIAALVNSLTRMLAYHPDIQDKVYEELYSIYGSADPADRPIITEDLPRLEYLECAINESMRLFPPVGFIERDIRKNVNIGSCVLPAGSTVIINILSLHRNEKCWSNPYKFDPDRFLPENAAKRVPGAYVPFSIGPRNCIGGKYAIMVAKILVATLLRRYILRVDTLVPLKDIRLKGNIVLEFVEPWTLRIEERNPGKAEAKQ